MTIPIFWYSKSGTKRFSILSDCRTFNFWRYSKCICIDFIIFLISNRIIVSFFKNKLDLWTLPLILKDNKLYIIFLSNIIKFLSLFASNLTNKFKPLLFEWLSIFFNISIKFIPIISGSKGYFIFFSKIDLSMNDLLNNDS